MIKSPFLFPVLVLFYSTFQASHYLFFEFHGGLQRYSRHALFFWVAPFFFFYALVFLKKSKPKAPNLPLSMSAFICTLLGVVGTMNTLKYVGFSLAIASFVPLTLLHIPWILSAVFWMPASSWFMMKTAPSLIFPARLVLCFTTSLLVMISLVTKGKR